MVGAILLPGIGTTKTYGDDYLPCNNFILRFFCCSRTLQDRYGQMARLLWIQAANRLALPDMWDDHGDISFRSGSNLTGFLHSAGMCFIMFSNGYHCIACVYDSCFRNLFSLSKSFFRGSKNTVYDCCYDNYNCIRLGGDISPCNSDSRKLIPSASDFQY